MTNTELDRHERTLCGDSADVRSRISGYTRDCDWLIQFEYMRGRSVEECVMAVRVFLAMCSTDPHELQRVLDTPETQDVGQGGCQSR